MDRKEIKGLKKREDKKALTRKLNEQKKWRRYNRI